MAQAFQKDTQNVNRVMGSTEKALFEFAQKVEKPIVAPKGPAAFATGKASNSTPITKKEDEIVTTILTFKKPEVNTENTPQTEVALPKEIIEQKPTAKQISVPKQNIIAASKQDVAPKQINNSTTSVPKQNTAVVKQNFIAPKQNNVPTPKENSIAPKQDITQRPTVANTKPENNLAVPPINVNNLNITVKQAISNAEKNSPKQSTQPVKINSARGGQSIKDIEREILEEERQRKLKEEDRKNKEDDKQVQSDLIKQKEEEAEKKRKAEEEERKRKEEEDKIRKDEDEKKR